MLNRGLPVSDDRRLESHRCSFLGFLGLAFHFAEPVGGTLPVGCIIGIGARFRLAPGACRRAAVQVEAGSAEAGGPIAAGPAIFRFVVKALQILGRDPGLRRMVANRFPTIVSGVHGLDRLDDEHQ